MTAFAKSCLIPPDTERRLTQDEVVRCASEGAHFAVDRYGVDPRALERIEEGGHLETDSLGGAQRIRRELPWSVKELSRLRFATIGPSNHFIEFQQVEEVLDAEAAGLLGIEAGQVTLQYHGGGGALTGELGVLFGRPTVIMTSNIGASDIASNTTLGFAGERRRDGRQLYRRHEEPDHGRAEEGVPARVPEPHRRRHRLPQAAEGRDQADRRAPAAPDPRVDGRARGCSSSSPTRRKDLLVEKGWDRSMGARPLRRAIQRYIEDPLAGTPAG